MTAFAPTLASRSLPTVKPAARDLLLVTAGALFIAALSQVRIPLPFTPVPLTGQTFAVLLVGAALGAKRGFGSISLYLACGALGLPFFAGGASGPAYMNGPTLGYLVGFAAAATLTGFLAERGLDRRIPTALVAFLAGQAMIYLFGVAWLTILLGFQKALLAGLAPFLLGDALKIVAAALALPAAWRLVK
jgi:biotin transport system substrate-specific component